jgi:hypothetical protein
MSVYLCIWGIHNFLDIDGEPFPVVERILKKDIFVESFLTALFMQVRVAPVG